MTLLRPGHPQLIWHIRDVSTAPTGISVALQHLTVHRRGGADLQAWCTKGGMMLAYVHLHLSLDKLLSYRYVTLIQAFPVLLPCFLNNSLRLRLPSVSHYLIPGKNPFRPNCSSFWRLPNGFHPISNKEDCLQLSPATPDGRVGSCDGPALPATSVGRGENGLSSIGHMVHGL